MPSDRCGWHLIFQWLGVKLHRIDVRRGGARLARRPAHQSGDSHHIEEKAAASALAEMWSIVGCGIVADDTKLKPRLLSRQEAAAYCGVSVATFSGWVTAGHMPRPLFGSKRWDKRAIDAQLDEASGLAVPMAANEEDPYDRWLRTGR